MKDKNAVQNAVWQKTPFANLVRYVASGKYFARLRVGGKLIRRSLKTNKLAVTKGKVRRWPLASAEGQETVLAHPSGVEPETF